MTYYVGEWNGHKLVLENRLTCERLTVDGAVLAEGKQKGLSGSTVICVNVPDTEGYFYNLYMNGTGMAVCSCIIGKPAEAVADGDAKTFTASFDGHTVTAVCDQTMTLTVDGEQIAENAAECEKFTVKSGKKDVNGKAVIAVFEKISGKGMHCAVFADAELVDMVYSSKNGDEYVPITEEDQDDAAAGMIATLAANNFLAN